MDSSSAILLTVALCSALCCAAFAVRLLFEAGGMRKSIAGLKVALKSGIAKTVSRAKRFPLVGAYVSKRELKRRMRDVSSEMPQALRMLCLALNSGSSLIQAMEYVAFQTKGAVALEFRRAVWDMKAGHGFDETMERLRNGASGNEFAYLAVAMEIQHRSGGSLALVLESALDSLQQSAELQEELVTKTTQARLSARVVGVMPFVVLIALSLLSPSYLQAFTGSAAGIALLFVACLLEIAGMFAVRRALTLRKTGKGAAA